MLMERFTFTISVMMKRLLHLLILQEALSLPYLSAQVIKNSMGKMIVLIMLTWQLSNCSELTLICSSFLDGQPLLASGGSSGVISIWNLEKRRLQAVIKEAHDGPILSLHFLANEPVLMSSASDNSIKVSSQLFGFIVHLIISLTYFG